MKKTTWVFFFHKYSKFWSILLDKKVDLKLLFSEEGSLNCSIFLNKIFYNRCIRISDHFSQLSHMLRDSFLPSSSFRIFYTNSAWRVLWPISKWPKLWLLCSCFGESSAGEIIHSAWKQCVAAAAAAFKPPGQRRRLSTQQLCPENPNR